VQRCLLADRHSRSRRSRRRQRPSRRAAFLTFFVRTTSNRHFGGPDNKHSRTAPRRSASASHSASAYAFPGVIAGRFSLAMKENRTTTHQRWGGPRERERCLREARRYLPDADAEDAVQDALFAAWRKEDAWVPATGPLPLLLTITRYQALQSLRRRRPRPIDEVSDRAVEDSQIDTAPLRIDVTNALNDLPADDRTLLELRYWDDLTQSDLATRLGIPEGTVKVRLHRLRARLRAVLGPDGEI
jgi:RNA polymerase sigma-70 factor (ECF subfamily)